MHIDINTWIGDAYVTLSCLVKGGSVERVTPYWNDRKHPKLQRWAEAWLDSDDGRDAVSDALYKHAIGEEDAYVDFRYRQSREG